MRIPPSTGGRAACWRCVGRALIAVFLAQGLLAGSGVARAQMSPVLEAGYRAGIMCSAVFLAGRDPGDVIREELDGLEPFLATVSEPVVDYTARAVTVAYAGSDSPRLAVYREGFGSVLLPPALFARYHRPL